MSFLGQHHWQRPGFCFKLLHVLLDYTHYPRMPSQKVINPVFIRGPSRSPGCAAQPLSPKVRGFPYVATTNRSIVVVHAHWPTPPEVRLFMLLSEIKRPTNAKQPGSVLAQGVGALNVVCCFYNRRCDC